MQNRGQYYKRNQIRTNKIADRLTYSPKKHKMKNVRAMKKKLQATKIPSINPTIDKKTLKFASFNVNGLDLEVGWTICQLLETRGYDVSTYSAQGTWQNPGFR